MSVFSQIQGGGEAMAGPFTTVAEDSDLAGDFSEDIRDHVASFGCECDAEVQCKCAHV